MKTRLLRISLITAIAAAGAWAQYSEPVSAYVPFDFVAGNQQFHAGQYKIDQFTQAVVKIAASNGKGVFVPTRHAVAASVKYPHLTFNRYGNVYFLSEIWPKDATSGRLIPTGRQERALIAKANVPPGVVLLALR